MIVKIEKSKKLFKRFKITMDDGKVYNFGLKNGKTFIDGESELTKENYKKRHLGNEIEKKLITNLIPSPSLFSYYILWNTRNIDDNINYLNSLWKKKHSQH